MIQALKHIKTLINPSTPLLYVICSAVLLSLMVAGLWPFNFFPKNEVSWLSDRNGVHFYGQGMIISSDFGQKQQPPFFPDKSITLEVWLRPLLETCNAPNIFTLYDGKTPDVVTIKQWKSNVFIWSRTDDPNTRKPGKPYQAMGVSNTLLKGRDVFITITSDSEGSFLYLNGNLARTYPHSQLLTGKIQGNISIILGNSPTGESYWTGDLLGLAIYNRALPAAQVSRNYQSWQEHDFFSIKQQSGLIGLYPFYERKGEVIHNIVKLNELIIPDTFKPLKRIILSSPWQDFRWNLSFAQDVTINLLGFIPFGFFFTALLIRKSKLRRYAIYIIVAIVGTGLSVSIELIQAYLPTRFSQFLDVICNSVGTVLGIAFFQILNSALAVNHNPDKPDPRR